MNRRWLAAGLIALLLPCAALAGQKKSKSKDQKKNQPAVNADALLPDPQRIDHEISEMLGAWQVGDTNLMHSFYADDVTVVSGEYEPPLMGWAAYLAAYQRQRERLSSLRLDRHNSYIYTRGGVAWATYQWEFQAMVDGKPTTARGHTTLVLEKQGDRWLIVHNHTSAVCDSITTAPPSPHPGS
jgi:ketosteroid isomerase-like protein